MIRTSLGVVAFLVIVVAPATVEAQFVGAPPAPRAGEPDSKLTMAKARLDAANNEVRNHAALAAMARGTGSDVANEEKALVKAIAAAVEAQVLVDQLASARLTATWRLIGSGYGQLINATDSASAFAVGVAYSYEALDAVVQLQRGNKTDPLTSTRQIGQFLLTPLAGNYAMALAFDYRPCQLWKNLAAAKSAYWGWYGYFNAGTSSWSGFDHHPTPTDTTPSTFDAVGLAAGVGMSAQVASAVGDAGLGTTGQNRVSVTGRIGAAFRGIAGSVLSSPEFLEQNTSRRSTTFVGAEVQLALQLNSITVAVAMPVLAGHLDGLTNGQVVPSLQLGGSFDISAH